MTPVRSLAAIPPLMALALILVWPAIALAQSLDAADRPFEALWHWAPFLITRGFLFNILISFLCLAIGTFAGVLLGLGQISLHRPLRGLSWFVTQLFRNSPWLVLLFIVMLALPFEVTLFGRPYYVPGWIKAVIGLSLPVMANIAEIVRGAVRSVPSTQWEAAESLAFTRRQILWRIILPQCFKRMIPPWMNWYAILTMATPLVSILGVEEVVNLTRQAIVAEQNRPELLMPFYGFVLVLFFAYCYPIARLTLRLERKFAVKL
ncbi:MAG: amino acid ABC transporter permease [Phaeovulum sp.]|nr:amino acid ABC transporter permease [Phaeovulum sp.]MDP1668409.1 amino acid ABC transporter permease [Phaeovulum sp.]